MRLFYIGPFRVTFYDGFSVHCGTAREVAHALIQQHPRYSIVDGWLIDQVGDGNVFVPEEQDLIDHPGLAEACKAARRRQEKTGVHTAIYVPVNKRPRKHPKEESNPKPPKGWEDFPIPAPSK